MTDIGYQLSDATRRAAAELPFDPERYFSLPEGTRMIAVDQLVLSRARAEGIDGAVRKMAEAYRGERAMRQPISVRSLAEGGFAVVDGNSTVIIARAAGWPAIPAMLVD